MNLESQATTTYSEISITQGSEISITQGNPIGLLLTLTYSSSFLISLYNIQTPATTSYTLETQS